MGEIFGKYELVEKVGQGGMAEVFLARSTGAEAQEVAIKRMVPNLAEDQEVVDMFLDEARTVSGLHHPNIVEVLDVGVAEKHLYIAMEFIEGQDLRTVLEHGIEADNSLPLELAVNITAQVASGLHHAHSLTDDAGSSLNIVHRDVSPQNVMIGMDGAVKLGDFGIAKAEHRISESHPGEFAGKFSYMSPEQIESGEADARSDIFALGILLYETTTMSRLFTADNQFEALENILYSSFEPPSRIRSGYPPELDRIVMKALSRDPGKRQQSAEELQLELENWLVQSQASTSPVQIARYMRTLFGEMMKAKRKARKAAAETPAVEPAPAAAPVAAPAPAPTVQSPSRPARKTGADVTEMSEDDLDSALDNALGAPGGGSSDPFALQTPSEATEMPPTETADAAPVPAAKAPEPEPEPEPAAEPVMEAQAAETVVDQRTSEEFPVPQAQTQAPTPAAPTPAVASVAAPPVAAAPAAAAPVATGPAVVGPPGGAPPTGRPSVSGPPRGAGPPPASKSQEAKAQQAFEPAAAPSGLDMSSEFDEQVAFKPGKKKGIFALLGVLAALAVIGVIVVMSLDTTGSHMDQQAENTKIDPELLETKVAEPLPRINVTVEVTPEDASVIVNGLPVAIEDGQIPLAEGVKNEIAVFADGHVPQRAYLDGVASRSPLTIALEPADKKPETADLQIVTEPRDAIVFVDGKQIGMTPTTVQGLDTSFDHHVYIKKDGYFGYAGLIGLMPKAENVVDTKLAAEDSPRKNYVELVFSAVPRGARVSVDGEQVGSTKSFKNYDRNQHHTVEFTEPDSAPARYYVLLEEVGVMELRPYLQPMKREQGTVSIAVQPRGPDIYVGPNAYGKGPTEKIAAPAGKVKVVLDDPGNGRSEVALDVVGNEHTDYTLSFDSKGRVRVKVDR